MVIIQDILFYKNIIISLLFVVLRCPTMSIEFKGIPSEFVVYLVSQLALLPETSNKDTVYRFSKNRLLRDLLFSK